MATRKKKETEALIEKEASSIKRCREPQKALESPEAIITTENTTKIQNTIEVNPEPMRAVFNYNGVDFIVLASINNGIGYLAISANLLPERMRFNDNAELGSNDWKKSTIRKKLNTEYIKKFNENDLLPITSDLTADTGEDDYGTCDDLIALPSDNLIRKYNHIIPTYNTWIWTLTPWAIKYSNITAVGARTQSKTLYSEQPNRELGVAIVCTFKKEAIELRYEN